MKKFISLALCFVMLFALASCAGSPDKQNSLTKITLCLDWTPNTNHTGIYVALAKGYYEQAGIELTVVQPPEGGAELMTAANQAQFGISAQDSLAATFASDEPLNISAVATILQHNTSGIISRKGEGCDTPKGLENKRYSTWDAPTEKAIIKNVMEADGGDFSKVKLIPNVITNEAEALRNKDTDAVWIYYAWSGINAEITGLPFDYFDFREFNDVFDFYTPIIIANNDFLKDNPDVAKAFLSATRQGYEYAIANTEEAAQILIDGDTTGSLDGSYDLVLASQKWINAQYISDAEKWGVIDPVRWNTFYNWLGAEKLTEKVIPENTGFTNDYLS